MNVELRTPQYFGSPCERLPLAPDHHIALGRLPSELDPSDREFAALWDLHPSQPRRIHLYGRPVTLPRWEQAYGRDYHFSGAICAALPVPPELDSFIRWAQCVIETRLNGVLVNWYDGKLGHYIGKHRDSIAGLVDGVPVVTISLGETRVMRLRRWKGTERLDVQLDHRSVVVIPYATNRAWTHEIVKSSRACTRRISLTLRAFA